MTFRPVTKLPSCCRCSSRWIRTMQSGRSNNSVTALTIDALSCGVFGLIGAILQRDQPVALTPARVCRSATESSKHAMRSTTLLTKCEPLTQRQKATCVRAAHLLVNLSENASKFPETCVLMPLPRFLRIVRGDAYPLISLKPFTVNEAHETTRSHRRASCRSKGLPSQIGASSRCAIGTMRS